MNKILVLAPHPFFTPRGTPFSVYYRTLVTTENGISVDLLTYNSGDDVDIAGCNTIRIPRFKFCEPIPIGPSGKKLFLDIFMIIWTIKLLITNKYAAVHAHEEAVFWARVLKPIFRYRLIYDMHSSLPQQLENFSFSKSRALIGIFKFLEDSCLKAADAVITICPDLRDYVLGNNIPEERHFLIENSIFDDVRLISRDQQNSNPATATGQSISTEENRFLDLIPQDKPMVLYAGTFESYQGIDILIDAFVHVFKKQNATLVLAGGTPNQVEAMKNRSVEAGISDHCIFTGRVPKSEAMELNAMANVLLSPRVRGTNTPLKIYEQLASGKPLIATNIYSHTQVLDNTVCFLVEPDPESMSEGILQALDNTELAQQRAQAAISLYEEKYSRQIYEKKLTDLFKSIGINSAPA